MPVKLFKEFNLMKDSFSNFITDYHEDVCGYLNNSHRGLGVVGPEKKGKEWNWSCIRVTNGKKSIDIATCLNSLYVHAYLQVLSDENAVQPWMKINENMQGFSGLKGEIRIKNPEGEVKTVKFKEEFVTMAFDGGYEDGVKDFSLSKESLNAAIYDLDTYATTLYAKEGNKKHRNPTSVQIKNARKGFLLVVVVIAESLRIIPVHMKIERAFDSNEEITLGPKNFSIAQNWKVISKAHLYGDYSKVGFFFNREEVNVDGGKQWFCKNDKEVENILWLVKYSPKNEHVR